MLNEVVLDIETQNTFQEVGKYDPRLLKVSLVGVYDFAKDAFQTYREEELPKLWPLLEHADRLIGYNTIGFDLPVLNNYYPGDLGTLPQLDIMAEIEKHLGFRVKLDDVAQATLGVGKTGSGLMAVEYFRKGEWDKLRDYNLADVRVTRDVYAFGRVHGYVRFKDRTGTLRDVPVDFSAKAEKKAVNLTMPL